MIKTAALFFTGVLLSIGLLLTLFFVIGYFVPGGITFYSFFALEIFVGAAIGLYVGFLQRKNAGILAAICLVPFPLWRVSHPHSPLFAEGRLAVFLFGELLSIAVAVGLADRLSKARAERNAT